MPIIMSSLVFPLFVALVISYLTSRYYYFFHEGERKSDAVHSSVQLMIGNISKDELGNLLTAEQIQNQYLLSLTLKDDQSGDYILRIQSLSEVHEEELSCKIYKMLRFTNIGCYGAVIRQIIHLSGGNQQSFSLERKESFCLESKMTFKLYMNGPECPDTITWDYPKYKLIFDHINAPEPYVRIPRVEPYRFKRKK